MGIEWNQVTHFEWSAQDDADTWCILHNNNHQHTSDGIRQRHRRLKEIDSGETASPQATLDAITYIAYVNGIVCANTCESTACMCTIATHHKGKIYHQFLWLVRNIHKCVMKLRHCGSSAIYSRHFSSNSAELNLRNGCIFLTSENFSID